MSNSGCVAGVEDRQPELLEGPGALVTGPSAHVRGLQAIVEELAVTINRSVSIDDRQNRLLAHSALVGEADPVAAQSILDRRSPTEAAEWLDTFGISRSRIPVRTPANPTLKMLPRLCVPVRFGELLLGYLWIIDVNSLLTDDDMQHVTAAATEASVVLFRERTAAQEQRQRAQDLLLALLFSGPKARGEAADELRTFSLLCGVPHLCAAVVTFRGPEASVMTDAMAVRVIGEIADAARRNTASAVVIEHGDEIVVVFGCPDGQEAIGFAGELRLAAAAALSDELAWECYVGVSDAREALIDIHAAYPEARDAACLAAAVPSEGSVVSWGQMGGYRAVLGLLHTAADPPETPEIIMRLLRSREAATLLETLEAYLELAGNAKATASTLHLHRSSLYSRLRRIEMIAEVDLHSGDDRLELHVGLRCWRLAGSPWYSDGTAPPAGSTSSAEWRRRASSASS